MPEIAGGLLCSLQIIFAGLAIGTGIRIVASRTSPAKVAQARLSSLLVWWLLFILLATALLLGKLGLSIAFCGVGLLALREFHDLYGRRSPPANHLAMVVALLGVCHYGLLTFTDWLGLVPAFPLLVILGLSISQIVAGESDDYLRASGGYLWAAIFLFLSLSYLVVMLKLPISTNSFEVGAVGWPLYVVLLTESDDIAQAVVGRRFGRHPMTPAFSPGKTWEGFVGGLLVTLLLAVVCAPYLTSLTDNRPHSQGLLVSLGAGLVVSLAGIVGDVNMSALKREAGVKDSSSLLPGMGGMLDRIDSLTLTSPAVYYYALLFVNEH